MYMDVRMYINMSIKLCLIAMKAWRKEKKEEEEKKEEKKKKKKKKKKNRKYSSN